MKKKMGGKKKTHENEKIWEAKKIYNFCGILPAFAGPTCLGNVQQKFLGMGAGQCQRAWPLGTERVAVPLAWVRGSANVPER